MESNLNGSEKASYWFIKGALKEFDPETQERVLECAKRIEKIIDGEGTVGLMALALVGSKKAVEAADREEKEDRTWRKSLLK